MDWSLVKGCLQDKLVEQETHRVITTVRGKFLPLSVYQKKGYDVKVIEETAEKQKSDMFGYVYRVPILEVSYSKIEEEVRTRLLEAERKMGKRKAAKKPPKEMRLRRRKILSRLTSKTGNPSTALLKMNAASRKGSLVEAQRPKPRPRNRKLARRNRLRPRRPTTRSLVLPGKVSVSWSLC